MTLNGWGRLSDSLEANVQDFPQLESYRLQLSAMLALAREITAQQAAMAASKQDASRRLRALLGEGRKLATFLRTGVRQRPAAAPRPDPSRIRDGGGSLPCPLAALKVTNKTIYNGNLTGSMTYGTSHPASVRPPRKRR